MTDVVKSPREITEVARTVSTWVSPRGLNTSLVPWRLWEKAKRLMWDPADLDFSRDASDWASLSEDQQITIAALARTFMIGEEAVTADIAPLMIAVADEGRLEEAMYLTTFAFEEAKHVDFFRRWFDAIGADPVDLLEKERARAEAMGFVIQDPEHVHGMFENELPRVMRQVLVDRSPRALLDAAVTYNQFVEGCLAMSGYRLWGELFDTFGILPGMREGLRLVRRDESRHLTYGTYLARRVIAAHPELLDFARERLIALRRVWWVEMTGTEPPADRVDQAVIDQQLQNLGLVNGGGGHGGEPAVMPPGAEMLFLLRFFGYLDHQVDARTQVMERAAALSEEEAVEDLGAEEAEADLVDA